MIGNRSVKAGCIPREDAARLAQHAQRRHCCSPSVTVLQTEAHGVLHAGFKVVIAMPDYNKRAAAAAAAAKAEALENAKAEAAAKAEQEAMEQAAREAEVGTRIPCMP